MADSQLKDLTVDASPTSDDIVYVVNDPGGSPSDKKVTLANLGKGIDHSVLANLTSGDPHTQYRLESADHTHQSSGAEGGQLDHGLALTGLTDDDHSAYLLASDATNRATFATNWTDLTDGGQTVLHSHAGAAVDYSTITGKPTDLDLEDAVGSERITDRVFVGPDLQLTELADGSGDAVQIDPAITMLMDDAASTAQSSVDLAADMNTLITGVDIVIDGGGSAITTGVKLDVRFPTNFTILGNTLLADQSGSIVIDIWKDTLANFPPTVLDTITASAKPTLSAAASSEDKTITGWTTAINAGDILRFNVDSASTVTRVTLALMLARI